MAPESVRIRPMAAFLPFWLLLAGAPGEAPTWSKAELKELIIQANAVGRMAPGPPQLQALAGLGGQAYRIQPQPSEPVEPFAQRVVKVRQPHHPTVGKNEWITALSRQLYADFAQRCSDLRRFERDKADDQFLQACANDFAAAAQDAEKSLTYVIEGLEGFVEPLPIADGEELVPLGCMVMVRRGAISIENMDRVRFENDQPAPDAARTKRGALREIYSAQQQFNVSNKMIGMYESQARRQVGHVRVAIPGRAPALYLNEIYRGAREADMHTLHLMVMANGNTLREIPILLKPPAKPKKKPKKGAPPPPELVSVGCADGQPMDLCARKLEEARKKGPILYQID